MENLQSLSEEVLAGALQTFVQEGTKLLNAVSADAVSSNMCTVCPTQPFVSFLFCFNIHITLVPTV